jgi:E3 ubiquitin-protein ligase HUWE1
MSRDANAVSFGSFNFAHFYMSDALIQPPDHARDFPLGNHRVGGPLSSLEFRVNPLYLTRRRALGDGRWTDNGRAQAEAQAAVMAQAVEEQFIHLLCNLTEVNDHPGQGLVESTDHQDGRLQITIPLGDFDSQSILTMNRISEQQYIESQVTEVKTAVTQETENIEDNGSGFTEFITQNRVEVDATLAEEGGEPTLRSSDSGCQDGVGIVSNIDQSSGGLGVETGSANRHPEIEHNPVALMPAAHDLVFGCQDSQATGTMLVESLHSLGVESRSADGFLETQRQSRILSVGASNVGVLDTAPGKTNEEGTLSLDEEIQRTDLDNEDEQAAADPNHTSNEAPSQQVQGFVEVGIECEQVDRNNGDSGANAIDPTFLEAIPEDLRAEVLASQYAQPVPAANYGPPAEEIDPEFLAALPPDIQAEVLAQQHSQRVLQAHQAEGQGVDMDNASFIATLPTDLREEVLLNSSEEVLASLPSPMLAEAQMLRDRARSHYQAHSLFGVDHRPSGRQNSMANDGQPTIDPGTVHSVGLSLGSKLSSSLVNGVKVKEVEGKPLVDTTALKSLLQLLRLAQPLDKELLQRLLLNLCAHSATQTSLIQLLLDMVRPETGVLREYSDEATSQRLYGCQWNVVYTRSQLSNGLPPLVSRRVLEILTYLATNHLSAANLLFYMEPCSTLESSCRTALELNKAKGKEKVLEKMSFSWSLDGSQKGEISLVVLLKLLKQPLVLRSSSHLEQVLDLLNVLLNNVEVKAESQSSYGEDVLNTGKEIQVGGEDMPEMVSNMASNTERHECFAARPKTEVHKSDEETKRNDVSEASISSVNKAMNPHDIFSRLSEPDLQNICKLLAQEGLSAKVYSLAAEILKKLASMTSLHSKQLISELVKLAGGLSDAAMCELVTLANTEMLGLSSHSMAGEAILRILKALTTLVSGISDGIDGHQTLRYDREQEGTAIFRELIKSLEPLWQALSVCISKTETKLGNISTSFTTTSNRNSALDSIEATAAMSPPLPLGSQRLLPFIEAFFILCEKLHLGTSIMQMDNCDVTAREIKEAAACTSFSCAKPAASPQKKEEGSAIFVRFAEKHQRLLNALIRQNPGLLEKSLFLLC